MSELEFVLLGKEEDAIRYAFYLRNLPSVRSVSLHKEEKEYHSFKKQYLQTWFSEPALAPLVLLKEGKRCGLIYFKMAQDPTKQGRKTIDLSIVVDEPFQGQGIGKEALRRAVALAKEQGYGQVVAKILPQNERSKRAFLSSGFQFFDAVTEKLFDKSECVVYERWLYQDLDKQLFDRVFIVAECGSNWKAGSFLEDKRRALSLIDCAKNAGCDAVKFQSFIPELLYAKGAGKATYLQEKGVEETMEELFQNLAMPQELFEEVAAYTKKAGLEFMCTPFSEKDFDRVDPYVRYHKIASYELSHLRLLEKAAHSKKPLFLSTGGATVDEIAFAVEFYKKCGGSSLVLLQCTANYPASPSSMNLTAISFMRNQFKVDTGLSDHSLNPLIAPIGAVFLGAQVIEKHLTLDRSLKGPDHSFSITPEELKKMVEAVRLAEEMKGDPYKHPQEEEKELMLFASRAVQATKEIKEGDLFLEGENVAILRPGNQVKGVHPLFLEQMDKKPAKRFIAKGSGVLYGDW